MAKPEMTAREIREAASACRRAAWADATDDGLRVVLWNAGDAIRQQRREIEVLREAAAAEIDALRDRLARQALHLERAELDAEVMRRAAFGGQKGGAA